jgi:hypothetical protein
MVGDCATRESSVVRYCCSDWPAASARRWRLAWTSGGRFRISTFGMLSLCLHAVRFASRPERCSRVAVRPHPSGIRRFGRVEVRGEQLIITRAGPAVVTTASSVLFPSSAPSTWASTTTTRSCIGWSVPRFARVCPAQPPVSVEIAYSAFSRVLPRPDWAVSSRSDRPLIVAEVMWREVPLRLAIIQSFLETMNKSG